MCFRNLDLAIGARQSKVHGRTCAIRHGVKLKGNWPELQRSKINKLGTARSRVSRSPGPHLALQSAQIVGVSSDRRTIWLRNSINDLSRVDTRITGRIKKRFREVARPYHQAVPARLAVLDRQRNRLADHVGRRDYADSIDRYAQAWLARRVVEVQRNRRDRVANLSPRAQLRTGAAQRLSQQVSTDNPRTALGG
ncbi:hypothetical protein D3C84_872000 [compost metagenome]